MATKFYARQGIIFKGNSLQPPDSAFDLERLLKWQLGVLNVPFNDDCCDASTQLPVSADADGILSVYDPSDDSWSTDVTLNVDGGITGSDMIAGFFPTAAQSNIAAATGGAIPVTNYSTTINTDAGGDNFTLADGTMVGQMKKIRLLADGGGDAVITPATALVGGGTTITLDDAGDFVVLIWNGTAWAVIDNSGAAVA